MVENREIKCYEYINAIRDIEKYQGMGIYRLNVYREKIHNELCEMFGLLKEMTKKYTDNLDINSEKVAEDLYLNLLDESRKYYI